MEGRKSETEGMALYLIKLGEISLKGLNRGFFEKKLKNNIKLKIHPYRSVLTREKGRFYLYVDPSCPDEYVERTLKTTFGVVGFSRALVCNKDWDEMCACARRSSKRSRLRAVQERSRSKQGVETSRFQ